MLTALYIHIPFCTNICTYCDFHKEIAKKSKKEAYIDCLLKELEFHKNDYSDLKTIYIGGGTPSSLDIILLERLLKKIKDLIDLDKIVEFSFECNPNDVNFQLVSLFEKYQVSRFSLGVQTFNEKHLKFLGRTHDKTDVFHAVDLLNKNGLTNISIDLIFAIINQTEVDLLEDIKTALTLEIKHISYYSLILEEKTKLYDLYHKKQIELIEEDLEGKMYRDVIDHLVDNGFNHYEISNFSKKGYESQHNKIYWQNIDYLGLGVAAHSLIKDKRYYNIDNTSKYIELVNNDFTLLKQSYLREPLREELMMGLRLINGINIKEVNQKYTINIFDKYPKLEYFIENNILKVDDGYLLFTSKGLLLGNIVFEIF